MLASEIFLKVMNTLFSKFFTGLSVFFLFSFISFIQTSSAQVPSTNNILYAPGSHPLGKDYKAWLAEWWKANLGIPFKDHPLNKINAENPDKCFVGKDITNRVGFLAVAPVEDENPSKTCNVPVNMSIFFPIESSQCDYGQKEADITDDSKLTQCAKSGNDGVEISLIVDGVTVDYPIDKNRIMTDFFNVTLPKDNVYGDYYGTYKSQSEGYNAFLKPLSPGSHKLIYKVSVIAPPGGDSTNDYHQMATYNLIVK